MTSALKSGYNFGILHFKVYTDFMDWFKHILKLLALGGG